MNGLQLLAAPLRWAFRLLVALIILFEEWGYEPLRKAMGWIARLPLLRRLELILPRLPPYGALAVLVLPSLLILPLKVVALWLIANGHAFAGLSVIVGAKVVGTAVLAWVFQLIRPSLMGLPWFVALYEKWTAWKVELLRWVRGGAVWRTARALKALFRRLARSVKFRAIKAQK